MTIDKVPTLPPRDMPTAKHFLRRQYWQLLRVMGVMSHFSLFEHCCVNPWIMQRRKKPLHSTHTHTQHWHYHWSITNITITIYKQVP